MIQWMWLLILSLVSVDVLASYKRGHWCSRISIIDRLGHGMQGRHVSVRASHFTGPLYHPGDSLSRATTKTLDNTSTLWGESTNDQRIPHPKGSWCGKCFHLMTSSWKSHGSSWHVIGIFENKISILRYQFHGILNIRYKVLQTKWWQI